MMRSSELYVRLYARDTPMVWAPALTVFVVKVMSAKGMYVLLCG